MSRQLGRKSRFLKIQKFQISAKKKAFELKIYLGCLQVPKRLLINFELIWIDLREIDFRVFLKKAVFGQNPS